jgi:hypothetical protein
MFWLLKNAELLKSLTEKTKDIFIQSNKYPVFDILPQSGDFFLVEITNKHWRKDSHSY